MTDLDPTMVHQTPEPPTTADAMVAPDDGVTASQYEPAPEAAPATPVSTPGSAIRRRPVRWPVAIGLIALVLAVSAFVGILVTGRAPNAKVLAYVPADSVLYGEARLDLPGDQRLNLASFLSKFPGFADQSAIEGKLNELMDRFVGGVSNGDQSYTTDIQPWFDGELAFALGPLPDPATLSSSEAAAMDRARFLVLVSIKDEAGVTGWFKGLATSGRLTMSDESYGGTALTVLTGEGDTPPQAGYAVLDGKIAVFGDVTSVKAAIDTHGTSPFATQPSPKAALDATDSSHLGFVYVDTAALVDWAARAAQSTGSAVPGLDLSSNALRDLAPDWEAFVLRVEGDGVVLQTAVDRPASSLGPAENRASTLTDHVPASALIMGLGHDLGKTLTDTVDRYRSEPSMKSLTDSIDQVAGILGGVDGAVGWMGDAAYVINQADTGIEAGLIVAPTDRTAADHAFTSLRTLLALGGSQAGVSVRDETYNGATITIVDLGDLSGLLGKAGVQPDQLGPGMVLPTGHIELAYAVTDQVVAIGSGPSFVRHILDTTSATSIASSDRYKSLAGRLGNGTGVTFVDIAAIRGLLENVMAGVSPTGMSTYEQEVKPFLVPFDALIAGSSVNGGVSNGKVIITVK